MNKKLEKKRNNEIEELIQKRNNEIEELKLKQNNEIEELIQKYNNKIEELKLKQNNEIEELKQKYNKKIILIDISGNEIKLKKIVNIFTNTFVELYDMIDKEIKKINIKNIIVNEHVYVCQSLDNNVSYEINAQYKNKSILEFLDKDYDKDYIEVTLVYGSYFPYIKFKIFEYAVSIYDYYYYSNLRRQEIFMNERDDNYEEYENYIKEYYDNCNIPLQKRGIKIKKNSMKNFVYNLSKIDNMCIFIDEYEILESLIKNRIFDDGIIHISSQGSILLNKIFLLNEIKKYLIIN